MAQTITVLDFESTINSILAEYKDVINADVATATKQVAREAVRNVKAKAPTRTGVYKSSISSRVEEKGGNYAKSVVYAKDPHYRLTHLLEFGHAKVNGGRTRAFPHWAQAEQTAINDFEKKLREAIE